MGAAKRMSVWPATVAVPVIMHLLGHETAPGSASSESEGGRLRGLPPPQPPHCQASANLCRWGSPRPSAYRESGLLQSQVHSEGGIFTEASQETRQGGCLRSDGTVKCSRGSTSVSVVLLGLITQGDRSLFPHPHPRCHKSQPPEPASCTARCLVKPLVIVDVTNPVFLYILGNYS